MHKFIEEEKIADVNNVFADTFGPASNTHWENEKAIFTSEKLDKSDKMIDVENNLTISNAKYYE